MVIWSTSLHLTVHVDYGCPPMCTISFIYLGDEAETNQKNQIKKD